MIRPSLRGVIFVALLLGASATRADEIANARRAFLSGMKHFDLGEYKDALSDFKDGYRAKEDPVFLYNIAQCYRAMNQKGDAVRYYRTYLSRSPDAPNRTEVEQKIVSLQAAIEAERTTPSSPEVLKAPVTATDRSGTESRVLSTPTGGGISATPSQPSRQPVYKKWWLWTIVGVAAVGIGVGVGVGVAEGTSKASGTTFPVAAF